LGLRVSVAVYKDSAGSQEAISTFAPRGAQVCLLRHLTKELRDRGSVIHSSRVSSVSLPGIGQAARAVVVQARVTDNGHQVSWYDEAIAVREGRVVEWLTTTSGSSSAGSDRRLAAKLAGLDARVERYLETGEAGDGVLPAS
jgi:hypothetical protein